MAAERRERIAIHTGGCQCGAVRFAVYAEPEKIGLCHCRMCQKAVAGPFAVLAEVPWPDFVWTRGERAAFQSSSRAIRDFCAVCGTPLSYRHPNGKIIELLTGTFDQPARVPPTYAVGTEVEVGLARRDLGHGRQDDDREQRCWRDRPGRELPASRSRHGRGLEAEAQRRRLIFAFGLCDRHRLRPVHQGHQHVADDHQQEPGAELAEATPASSRGAGWDTSRRR